MDTKHTKRPSHGFNLQQVIHTFHEELLALRTSGQLASDLGGVRVTFTCPILT